MIHNSVIIAIQFVVYVRVQTICSSVSLISTLFIDVDHCGIILLHGNVFPMYNLLMRFVETFEVFPVSAR
jgi:hypothetical protein